MRHPLSSLQRDDAGVSAIEYALIASLISIAAFTVLVGVGTSVTGLFTTVAGGF